MGAGEDSCASGFETHGSQVITEEKSQSLTSLMPLFRLQIKCFQDASAMPLIGCICNAESPPIRKGFVDEAAGIP